MSDNIPRVEEQVCHTFWKTATDTYQMLYY